MGTSFSTPPAVASRRSGGPGDSALADALFTSSQQRVLALLFGQPDREFFVTEIIALAGCGRGAVQRELAKLAGSGIAAVSQVGNRKYYRANPDSPLFDEICGIVRKTVGVEESVRDALAPVADRLTLAVLFGSVARGTDTAASDIDLLLVSDDLTLEAVYGALAPAENVARSPRQPDALHIGRVQAPARGKVRIRDAGARSAACHSDGQPRWRMSSSRGLVRPRTGRVNHSLSRTQPSGLSASIGLNLVL